MRAGCQTPDHHVRSIEPPIDLLEVDLFGLRRLLQSWGTVRPELHIPQARRIYEAIHCDLVTDPGAIEGLPDRLRERLARTTTIGHVKALDSRHAADGEAHKELLELHDGQTVETVLLHYGSRHSACVSTQVGCACGCLFCATGQMGFVRDLTAGEIISQVLHVQRLLQADGEHLTNVVLMGMGEPFLNYAATITALARVTDQRGLSIPPRRVTVSTVGIPDAIRAFADDNQRLRVNLAISLHAATDAIRDHLVPINRHHSLSQLLPASGQYAAETGRRVMLEWVMLDQVNDTRQQADALVAALAEHSIPAHVNLIRLNPTSGLDKLRPSSPAAIAVFADILDAANVPHTVRQRRGTDIAAGCGQLRANQAASGQG